MCTVIMHVICIVCMHVICIVLMHLKHSAAGRHSRLAGSPAYGSHVNHSEPRTKTLLRGRFWKALMQQHTRKAPVFGRAAAAAQRKAVALTSTRRIQRWRTGVSNRPVGRAEGQCSYHTTARDAQGRGKGSVSPRSKPAPFYRDFP